MSHWRERANFDLHMWKQFLHLRHGLRRIAAFVVRPEFEGCEEGEGLQLGQAGVGQFEVHQCQLFKLGHPGEAGQIGIGEFSAIDVQLP